MNPVSQLIKCPKCKAILEPELFGTESWVPCPSCQSELQVEVFPALFHEAVITRPELITAEGEASCFFHPEKKAAIVCNGCGRFLCSLCEVDFDGQHFCTACLQSGKEKGKIKKLENRRTRHDDLALRLAILPLLIAIVTIVTAPATIFYSIKHWNSPVSLVSRRPKIKYTIAISVATVEIAVWTGILIYKFAQ